MPEKSKGSLKKGLAILICVAFVSMLFPGVSHAVTKPSSEEFLIPENLFSLISPFLSLVSHNFSAGIYDFAAAYCLSDKDKKPPTPTTEENGKKKQKSKGSYNDHGNSISKRKANGND